MNHDNSKSLSASRMEGHCLFCVLGMRCPQRYSTKYEWHGVIIVFVSQFWEPTQPILPRSCYPTNTDVGTFGTSTRIGTAVPPAPLWARSPPNLLPPLFAATRCASSARKIHAIPIYGIARAEAILLWGSDIQNWGRPVRMPKATTSPSSASSCADYRSPRFT